jgi:ribonuclease HI
MHYCIGTKDEPRRIGGKHGVSLQATVDSSFPSTDDMKGQSAYSIHVSGGGAVIFDHNYEPIVEKGEYYEYATNNQAEYLGLIIGLKIAIQQGIKSLLITGDSTLIINQCCGIFKIKENLLGLTIRRFCWGCNSN